MSNIGMGSILVNYYRKKHPAEEQPSTKYDLGELFMLDEKDESPFLKFGSVNPGQTIQALYTNLFRAPLFRHQAYKSDFLVIK